MPVVGLDNGNNGVCEISGELNLEDVDKFYNQIINWLNKYINEVKKGITFNFKLTYFNTASSRCILYILRILKKYEDESGQVVVNWYYPKDDGYIAEEAEDLMEYIGLKINIISFKPEN
jgi:hypothetical protein